MHNLILESPENISGYHDDQKHWYLKGVFARANHLNKNSRQYPKPILEKAVCEFLQEKKCLGTLDHENSPSVSLDRTAIKIESLWFEGDDLWGRALVLDTPCGKTLQAILRSGASVGLSTRGAGSVDRNGVVQEDFKISSIDAVASPSNAPLATAIYEEEEEKLISTFEDWLEEQEDADWIRRILKKGKNGVVINPDYKDNDENKKGVSAAAKTQHPNQRGLQGMKKEDARLTKGSRYLDPKDDSKDSSSNQNPYASKHKPKHQKIGGSKVKLEHADYIKTAHLLEMSLRHPDKTVRKDKETEFHKAMNYAANHMDSRKHLLYKDYRGLGDKWKHHKTTEKNMMTYAERMKKTMQQESYSTAGHLVTDSFIDACAKVMLNEMQMHPPKGNQYNVDQLTGTNPKGLGVGNSDNSRKTLTEPPLKDPYGVVPGWCDFFFDDGGGDSQEDDMEELATMFNYLAKKLGYNRTE